jgi:hypothetical protein
MWNVGSISSLRYLTFKPLQFNRSELCLAALGSPLIHPNSHSAMYTFVQPDAYLRFHHFQRRLKCHLFQRNPSVQSMQRFVVLTYGFAMQAQSAKIVPGADEEDLIHTLAKSLLSDRLLWLALHSGERLSATAMKMMVMTAVFPGQEGQNLLPPLPYVFTTYYWSLRRSITCSVNLPL